MNDGFEKTESLRNADFEAVLDSELDRLLNGRTSIDDCCAANPGYAEELRPLLQLAIAGRDLLLADNTLPGVETPAREKIMAHAHSLKASRKSGIRLRMRPLALTTGLFLLIFAGTALAAGSAEPDNFLYPVKQQMESARTTLAMQDHDQARAEAGHANARLDELQVMMDRGKGEYSGSLLADYEAHINDASAHAAAAAAAGEDTTEVNAVITSVRERHDAMVKTLGLGEGDDTGEDGLDDQRPEDAAGSGASPGAVPEDSGGGLSGSGDDSPGGNDGGNDSGGEGGSGDYQQPQNDGHSDGDSQSPSNDGGRNDSSGDGDSHGDTPRRDERHGESTSNSRSAA
ncbi:MAG: DUF5667 domain-containing protein [Thermoleophilia bacterium]|nr:DUF5667 domain-containing protein [Thermoleophilia bacterium]